MTTNNTETKGTLVTLVGSNPSEIMKERANQVLTNVHSTFKQKVDASYNKINELKIKKTELMHQQFPTTTVSTTFDVNAVEFVDKTVSILKELANEKRWFKELKEEYNELFGKEYEEPKAFF